MQTAAASRLHKLIVEVVGDPCGEYSLAGLASRAAMSERTFSRVFKQETGGPARRLCRIRAYRSAVSGPARNVRIEPVARVAERAGFGDISGLHRAFQKRLGVTPGDYRDRFGPARSASP